MLPLHRRRTCGKNAFEMHRSLGVSEVAAASFEAHERAEHMARKLGECNAAMV